MCAIERDSLQARGRSLADEVKNVQQAENVSFIMRKIKTLNNFDAPHMPHLSFSCTEQRHLVVAF